MERHDAGGSEAGLSPERLAELDAMVQAATDGPYQVADEEGRHVIRMQSAILNRGFYAPQHVLEWEHGLYPEDGDEDTEGQWAEADATINLMAAAPVAVPELLAEVRRLQQERDAWKLRAEIAQSALDAELSARDRYRLSS